ncbi:type II toxin-antitoxin system VapC family toxin [Kineococcus arenarius]|uniref:type II toxin-antitoxin system VapC family toxin n=1 Tax=Kineococcus sp. SYSU DK007 TaxID=3383128 RepID=UPI003D7D9C26
MIVLDTNVVSELMRTSPSPGVVAWIEQQPPAEVRTTAVTVAEVRYGIARLPEGRRRNALRAAADEVFSVFAEQVLPFDAAAAVHYADVVTERENAGTPISGFDAQIAAVCRSHHARLATRNTGDFTDLGLDLVDPWSTTG